MIEFDDWIETESGQEELMFVFKSMMHSQHTQGESYAHITAYVQNKYEEYLDSIHTLCDECDGTGHGTNYCSNCGGSGEGMTDGSHCYVCHGRGELDGECEECDGTGAIYEAE